MTPPISSLPGPSPDPDSAWRLVLETALDAVIVMDRRGDVVDWNENATAIFGWSRDEALGRKLGDLIVPLRFREAHTEGLRRFLETGEAKVLRRRIEIWALRRTGEEFPVELSISPMAEGDGLIFVGFLRDISERRSAERQREEHALKMEALYRTISIAAETISLDDALQVCLASVHKLTGWPLGHVYLASETAPVRLLPSPIWFSSRPDEFAEFRSATAVTSFAPGEGLPGRVWSGREPEWIADVASDQNFPRAKWPKGIEVKSALGFPIMSEDRVIAVIEFFSEAAVEPDLDLLLTLRAIGQQVGRVFERRHAEEALRVHATSLEIEIDERKRAQAHQKLLLAEVDHRVKNMLAVVTAIASQTARNSDTIDTFSQNFLARLHALSGAHSLLTERNWKATSLSDLVEKALSPYLMLDSQLDIGGPVVWLQPKAALSVSMVMHELLTNAAKYGALSVPSGRLSIQWATEADGQTRIRWCEIGVGPVSPPSRRGFGSAMINASVRHELKGQVAVKYGPDGVEVDLVIPMGASEESSQSCA
ncbi:MAG TPA: PAS domain S-box protein [Aurantimonas coralicida]|uniref:Blue-light-activated histidine kinase n=1 Tax=Aurantimonas coralicida TaxID=182270 RepID=A0A9C9NEA0_9HYPH|nr:PAS domain S-box protein [Aurantimonas coralicida]